MVKLPSLKRISIFAASLGMLFPVVALLLQTGRSVPRMTLALWPTSPFLMATAGHEHTFSSYSILAATIAGNALVYVFLFTVLWSIAWVIRAGIRSLRDGTTI